ncbi:MAG: oligoendopeptidase F [Bdellovibrionales bacterium]|nr:oligoendopeptidase F [Bdellovibrionales bacterium]
MATLERKAVRTEDTWDLTPLFRSWEQWELAFSGLEGRLSEIAQYKGTLTESAERIEAAFRLYLELSRELEKLYTFAQLNADVDLGDSKHQGYVQQVIGLHARFATEASFFTPELLSIDDALLQSFLADPSLVDYRRRLEEIARYKPHTLSEPEESLLARGIEVFGSAQKIFSQLNNVDLSFGTVSVDGKDEPLTHSTFVVFLKNSDRQVRKRAWEQYYRAFDSHRNTIAASLTASIKRDVYFGQVRKFPSSLERSLFADDVTPGVYNQLIDTVSANLQPLHRYYELRRERLGLQSLQLFDTYLPLVKDVRIEHSYEEAVDVIIEALAPLGSAYTTPLKAGLTTGRWVDRYENKGKRSGGYHSGCYDSPPYILMNYKTVELNDVFTLAHEAGHAMHTYFSVQSQPYQDHNYTIFVAEVASTFNEELLAEKLKQQFRDDKKLLSYLVNQQIDDIKATFFRQTMFAEFEKLTHEHAEANRPLTLDYFRETYRQLLAKYF